MKRGDQGSSVQVQITRLGSQIGSVEDLQLTGSSGATMTNGSFTGFDNINLPFEGSVRFRAANKMNSAVYDREVKFVVEEPGKWVLRIEI
ncbi:hypothetical protein [Pontibacter chitinilyticus]|uniref:hypothetical protein n=1 Tax=Pontibacter chitinilyticus TaxID=2674989 RepID=UPI003218F0FE